MMEIPEFRFDARFPRVVFGAGALEALGDEVERLGAQRVLVLCTPGRGGVVERVAALLGGRAAGVFDGARVHVPESAVREATRHVERAGADCCVTVGGGSATGLGKAVAISGGPPFIAVPTTFSGSEATSIWGVSSGDEKRTGRDPRALPRMVIYDPSLTLTLPAAVAGPSGINAIAHCLEALYAPDANPVTSLLAEEGARVLAESLPLVVRPAAGVESHAAALYGAWLAGSALGAVSMGLHHRLCHLLGGSFRLPHAPTHAAVLPHVAAFNRPAAADAFRRAGRALGADDVPRALYELSAAVGAPTALRDLGLRDEDVDRAAELAVERPYPNPRPASRGEVRTLLEDALLGRPPRRW